MSELANWVIQCGPNPWGPNSCRSIQQADLEFAKLKEMTKSKLFSRKSLKCAAAWAVWLVAKSLTEEKQAAQVEIQNLREENKKLKEIKAQQLKLEEGITREGAAAEEQVRSVLQYQEVCEQKKAILSENQALKEKVAISTKAVEEAQRTIRLLVQKVQILKERGTDHRACKVKMEKLKAALEAKHEAVTALTKTPLQRDGEHCDEHKWVNPDGNSSTEECKPASPLLLESERPERFKADPVSLTCAPVVGKRERGAAEQGNEGNVQPQAEQVITEGATTTDPRQFKPRSTQGRREQLVGSVWAREDRGGSRRGRGSRGRENSRDMRDPEVLQTTASAGVTSQSPFVGRGRKGRWQGKRQWQYGAGPRFVEQNTMSRRELGMMRVDIWRELRKQGEDMARWDNAPTRVLLDRLLEISRRKEGSEPGAPALPVTA
ncbi:uncharacterized protein LOC125324189 [Corvus hawaiiensis]|uniref:uncharacterized protein LOC125324189 n=1 Tax=Corvus hawaiiensis TaxID=134902 RepID=UPI00201911BD|nr:uncharacterized protein LOC125324189 [Corvus hawaiiensis]